MNEILKILFQSIPGMLYEPNAVGAVLGLFVAAVMYWKRHTPLYWWIGFSLIFMIGWRLGIQIISRRYASILIYPAVIATAYFCFQTELLVKYIPKFPVKWCKIVPYLFVIGLGIASIGQALHYNPYSDHILRTAKLIQNDAKGRSNPHILVIDQDCRRLSYYSGIPSIPILYSDLPEADYLKNIGKSLINNDLSEPADTVYLVLFESLKRKKGYYLQGIPEKLRKQIQYLGEFYHNRKKRRVTRVYRYDLNKFFDFSLKPVIAAEKTSKTKPAHSFTFNKTYPEKHRYYQSVIDYFGKQVYQKCPKLKAFPIDWHIWGTPGYSHDINAELGVVKDSNGASVFRLKSQDLITTYTGKMYSAKNWKIIMKVSGRKNTVFNFATHSYNAKYGWCAFPLLPIAKLACDHVVYEYTCTIPDGFYTPETRFIRPTICLKKGELFVHSIELYEQ